MRAAVCAVRNAAGRTAAHGGKKDKRLEIEERAAFSFAQR